MFREIFHLSIWGLMSVLLLIVSQKMVLICSAIGGVTTEKRWSDIIPLNDLMVSVMLYVFLFGLTISYFAIGRSLQEKQKKGAGNKS